MITKIDLLSSKAGLCSRRNFLQYDIIFMIVQAELHDSVPVLFCDEILVHPFNDLVDSALTSSLRYAIYQ